MSSINVDLSNPEIKFETWANLVNCVEANQLVAIARHSIRAVAIMRAKLNRAEVQNIKRDVNNVAGTILANKKFAHNLVYKPQLDQLLGLASAINSAPEIIVPNTASYRVIDAVLGDNHEKTAKLNAHYTQFSLIFTEFMSVVKHCEAVTDNLTKPVYDLVDDDGDKPPVVTMPAQASKKRKRPARPPSESSLPLKKRAVVSVANCVDIALAATLNSSDVPVTSDNCDDACGAEACMAV